MVRKNLKNEVWHLLAVLLLTVIFGNQVGWVRAFVLSFGFGFLLDVDHLIDYFIYLRRFKRKCELQEFVSGSYFKVSGKFYVFLHSWELSFVWLLLYIVWRNELFLVVFSAQFTHLIVDQITNNMNLRTYFLCYRYKKKFVKICKECY